MKPFVVFLCRKFAPPSIFSGKFNMHIDYKMRCGANPFVANCRYHTKIKIRKVSMAGNLSKSFTDFLDGIHTIRQVSARLLKFSLAETNVQIELGVGGVGGIRK